MNIAIGGDMLGTADNCTPIPRDKFLSEDSINFYCLDDETPYIYLKSKINEYIFTDQAFIVIVRDNAGGVKQNITRCHWQLNNLSNISFETPGAGMTDFACELKFGLGNANYSIDIIKSEIATARIYYSVLLKLSREMRITKQKLDRAESFAKSSLIQDNKNIGQSAIDASNLIHDTYNTFSYKHVFEAALSR